MPIAAQLASAHDSRVRNEQKQKDERIRQQQQRQWASESSPSRRFDEFEQDVKSALSQKLSLTQTSAHPSLQAQPPASANSTVLKGPMSPDDSWMEKNRQLLDESDEEDAADSELRGNPPTQSTHADPP